MKIKDFDKQLENYSINNKPYLEQVKITLEELKKLKQNNGKNLKFK